MTTSELYMERTPCEDFEMLNEAIWKSFTKGMNKSFKKSSSYGSKNYAQFGGVVNKAIAGGQSMANYMSKKTGVSPALALALTVAGMTGGASAIPMGAIMYFTRKHMNKFLGGHVSALVDKGFDAFGQSPDKQDLERQQQQTSPSRLGKKRSDRSSFGNSSFGNKRRSYNSSSFNQRWGGMPSDANQRRSYDSSSFNQRWGGNVNPNFTQQESSSENFNSPRFENFSFKEWLLTEKEKGWGDWIAKKTGQIVGAGAGYIYGFSSSLLKSLGDRISDVVKYISSNPRQATKMAAIVGVAMLTGGIVGRISHDVVDAVSSKISQVMPSADPQDIQSTMVQVSPAQDAVTAKSQVAQDAVTAKSQTVQDAATAKSQAAQDAVTAKRDIFGRMISPDAQETKNLFRAMKDTFGGNSHELKMGSIPHGMTVDMNGDGIPDNPTFNYYNKTDHTFYGSDGKPEWRFDGKNIITADKNSFVAPQMAPAAPAAAPEAPEPAPAQSYLQTKMRLAQDRIAQMKQDAAEAERLGAASGNLPSVRTLPDGSVMKSFSGRLPPGYSK